MAQNIQHCFILFTGCGCCSSSFYSFLCFCFLTRATRSTFCFASFLVYSAEDNSCVSHATCSTIQLCNYACSFSSFFLLFPFSFSATATDNTQQLSFSLPFSLHCLSARSPFASSVHHSSFFTSFLLFRSSFAFAFVNYMLCSTRLGCYLYLS